MTDQIHRQIDWASADVHDATLIVALGREPTKQWVQRFKAVPASTPTALGAGSS